jgi:hypothetical protein
VITCACGQPALCIVDESPARGAGRGTVRRPVCAAHVAAQYGQRSEIAVYHEDLAMLCQLAGLVCWCRIAGLRVEWCPTHGDDSRRRAQSLHSEMDDSCHGGDAADK